MVFCFNTPKGKWIHEGNEELHGNLATAIRFNTPKGKWIHEGHINYCPANIEEVSIPRRASGSTKGFITRSGWWLGRCFNTPKGKWIHEGAPTKRCVRCAVKGFQYPEGQVDPRRAMQRLHCLRVTSVSIPRRASGSTKVGEFVDCSQVFVMFQYPEGQVDPRRIHCSGRPVWP